MEYLEHSTIGGTSHEKNHLIPFLPVAGGPGLAVLVAAQGKNDRAWLDLNQARTLWMASGNAAGLAVQAPETFNLVEARYDREDGSWRPLQSGEHTANVQFDTQGARQIGAVRLWGHFRYNNVNEKESSFNTLLYNPYDERFLYTAADSVEGQWKKQSYEPACMSITQTGLPRDRLTRAPNRTTMP